MQRRALVSAVRLVTRYRMNGRRGRCDLRRSQAVVCRPRAAPDRFRIDRNGGGDHVAVAFDDVAVVAFRRQRGYDRRGRRDRRHDRVHGPQTFINVHPYFYRWTTSLSFADMPKSRQCYRTLPVGELTMPETEKTKPEKPETRPIDDGFLSPPPPPKKKLTEPEASRASHFS